MEEERENERLCDKMIVLHVLYMCKECSDIVLHVLITNICVKSKGQMFYHSTWSLSVKNVHRCLFVVHWSK